ncbi:MAG: ABC transporter substrate-binding protein [Oscillatoria sp. SIO1A7]|nr:ABC transporter substrate-binding protein [Oscillatoria sp. SIO1A7]
MSQKKENILLLVSVAIAGCILVIAGWQLAQFFRERQTDPGNKARPGLKTQTDPNNIDELWQERISFGEKFLVEKEEGDLDTKKKIAVDVDAFRKAKQKGALAMAEDNYQEAKEQFGDAIDKYRNAPETLIYLNNARIGKSKSYTLAVAVPTASDPDLALEVLRGVAQAQDEINNDEEEGINGVPLKVAIANDDNDPKMAKKIALALVAKPKVLGVVGHMGSDATLAAAEVYRPKEMVAISAVSTSVDLSEKNWVFRTVPSDTLMARALSEAMANRLQKQKAAIFFNSDSSFSKSLKSEFAAEGLIQGIKVVAEFDFSANFSAHDKVKEAIDKEAQVLMLAPTRASRSKAFDVLTTNRLRLDLLGGDTLYSYEKTLDVGADTVGMLVAVPWHIESDSSDFPDRSRTLWGADVSWRTAMAYDATQAFIAALKQNPNRTGIRDALLSEDFSATGATGTILFMDNGDRRNAPVQLVEVCPADPSNPSRSGTGHYFAPITSNAACADANANPQSR